jgi:ketosteroid isomerase-like protein
MSMERKMAMTSTFDLDALRRGHAEHDAAGLAALYADDAVIRIVDAAHPPSTPMELRGKAEIRGFLDDVCGRDMTHEVAMAFSDGDRLAFQVACRYATGERVLTSETCLLEDGLIVEETIVQAWDS